MQSILNGKNDYGTLHDISVKSRVAEIKTESDLESLATLMEGVIKEPYAILLTGEIVTQWDAAQKLGAVYREVNEEQRKNIALATSRLLEKHAGNPASHDILEEVLYFSASRIVPEVYVTINSFIDQRRLVYNKDLHARLLGCVIDYQDELITEVSQRKPVDFWEKESAFLGSKYGLTVLMGIFQKDVDAYFKSIPKLVDTKEKAQRFSFTFPWAFKGLGNGDAKIGKIKFKTRMEAISGQLKPQVRICLWDYL